MTLRLDRRGFLATAAGAGLAAPLIAAVPGTVPAEAAPMAAAKLKDTAVFVPGYLPNEARANGVVLYRNRRMARDVADSSQPFRLLSRIGMDGSVTQALLPAKAHDVEVAPGGGVGVLCGFEGRDHVAFDPKTLRMVASEPTFADGWRGGGHAFYLADGKTVLLSERAPYRPARLGGVEERHGRITIRDADTLKVRGSYSTYGIDPHDIRLIENDRYLVAANYGSVPLTEDGKYGVPRQVTEAAITIIDMADGRLVDKQVTNRRDTEVRHLAAGALDRIFAIQARLGDEDAETRLNRDEIIAYGADITTDGGQNYMPAPLLKTRQGGKPRALGNDRQRDGMRHGLSIRYDPVHDQAIATFPSAHRLMIFDGASGAVVHDFDTRQTGLKFPCGVTLLPDGKHYAVTGYWENLYVFERGSHRLNRDLCLYPVFFGHSHITAA